MRISDWSSDVCSSDLTTFEQTTTGFQVNVGVPLTEFLSAFGRYSLNYDDVSLDKRIYYFGNDCDPLVAGRYLCDAIGKRTTSLVGFTLAYDDRDNRIRPTRGQSFTISQDRKSTRLNSRP